MIFNGFFKCSVSCTFFKKLNKIVQKKRNGGQFWKRAWSPAFYCRGVARQCHPEARDWGKFWANFGLVFDGIGGLWWRGWGFAGVGFGAGRGAWQLRSGR